MFNILSQEAQFLSQEEQECIQFFEKTIDSLEASLEEDDWRLVRARPTEEVDGPRSMSANPGVTLSPHLSRAPSTKDHEIIDLVRQEADFVHAKEPIVSPTHSGSVQQVFLCRPQSAELQYLI